jgi:hypothetical protein
MRHSKCENPDRVGFFFELWDDGIRGPPDEPRTERVRERSKRACSGHAVWRANTDRLLRCAPCAALTDNNCAVLYALIVIVYSTVSVPFLLSVTITVKVICEGALAGGVPLSVPVVLRANQDGKPLAVKT